MNARCALPADATVLVTGATGFTGAVLTRKLCAAGMRVRAIARPTSDTAPLAGLPVEWVRGDVYDPAVVAHAAEGAVFIFHLATGYRQGRSSPDYFRKVHIESTQLLAARAAATPGFQRFVHVSTVGVHGHIEGGPADESAPFAPGDAYQATKAEAEQWLHAHARATALPYTVIRPAAIMGPGDRRLLKLFRMAARPVFFILGRGRSLYHLIHVDDLTDALLTAAVHPAALGEAFICGNAEPIALPEIGRVVARELGRPLRVVRLPAWPFFAAAAACEWICRPLRIEPPLYRRRVAFFTKDRAFDTRKLRDVLGFVPGYTNETGLVSTTRWYREHGWL